MESTGTAAPATWPEPAEGSEAAASRSSVAARIWSGLLAAWGAFVGLLPHVLHHVGPLAGAALLAGATGRALFALVGFAAAIPFLLRLRRRFGSWRAPALALAVFAAMFSLSSFVVGPAIAGGDASPSPASEQPGDGHDGHH